MDYYTSRVAEFQSAFEPPNTKEFWLKLIDEEGGEAVEAAQHLLKELCDLIYVVGGMKNAVGEKVAQEILKDHPIVNSPLIGDLIGAFGESALMEAYDKVHIANMSKLGADGKPVRREDGKVLKGPNYEPADLSKIDVWYFKGK